MLTDGDSFPASSCTVNGATGLSVTVPGGGATQGQRRARSISLQCEQPSASHRLYHVIARAVALTSQGDPASASNPGVRRTTTLSHGTRGRFQDNTLVLHVLELCGSPD